MKAAIPTRDKERRLKILQKSVALDTQPEQPLVALSVVAAQMCDMPFGVEDIRSASKGIAASADDICPAIGDVQQLFTLDADVWPIDSTAYNDQRPRQ